MKIVAAVTEPCSICTYLEGVGLPSGGATGPILAAVRVDADRHGADPPQVTTHRPHERVGAAGIRLTDY